MFNGGDICSHKIFRPVPFALRLNLKLVLSQNMLVATGAPLPHHDQPRERMGASPATGVPCRTTLVQLVRSGVLQGHMKNSLASGGQPWSNAPATSIMGPETWDRRWHWDPYIHTGPAKHCRVGVPMLLSFDCRKADSLSLRRSAGERAPICSRLAICLWCAGGCRMGGQAWGRRSSDVTSCFSGGTAKRLPNDPKRRCPLQESRGTREGGGVP